MTSKELKVLVGSTSGHKLDAVRETFKEVYPGTQITVKGVEAISGVNEQPVGLEEIFQGAQNRLQEAKRLAQEVYDFAVGIENGILPVEAGAREIWFDVGLVIVENKRGQQSFSLSPGVVFPSWAVEEARKRGFATTTVGTVIFEKIGGERTDPQSVLTSRLVSRTEMLKQALKIALGQLQKDKVRID